MTNAEGGEVLLAPGGLNVDQELLEGPVSPAVTSLSTVAVRKGDARRRSRKINGRGVQQGPGAPAPRFIPANAGRALRRREVSRAPRPPRP